METFELSCRVKPLEPWRDILIADLAQAGFEGFIETEEGFKAYIPAGDYRPELVSEVFSLDMDPPPGLLKYEVNKIMPTNWNSLWESNFRPVTIGRLCYIRAPFHEKKPEIRYEIVIEPKMSFGTGHHETTVLMAEWLLETSIRGKAVLDMGCGTGILAILAAKRGAASVTAIDNYLDAWENALENAGRNHAGQIRVLYGDASLLGKDRYDVVMANITRNVLLDDMARYAKVLSAGGVMLLSGFLSFDKDVIFAEANRLGMVLAGEKTLKDWVSLKLLKPIR